MSRKNKTLLFSVIFLILLLIPGMVKATEQFTTNDGIVATKIVENTDGTIDFKFTNIELSAEGQYTWALGTTSSADDVKKWYTLGDYSETKKSAVLSLTPSVSDIKKVLRTTDTAWLFIKDEGNENLIVDALKVDLKLPLLKAFKITKSTWYNPNVPNNPAWEISNTYSITKYYYKMVKITDNSLIEQFNTNNGDLNSLPLATLEQAPEVGWQTCMYTDEVPNSAIPKDGGLYYLWVKGKDTDSKTVIGYTVVNFDKDGPTVKTIEVVSPTSGTYDAPQTVKIRVYFNETITGTSTPTLKIRFGESAERTVTNGTIKSNYVEYTYNIQGSDIGQLATVGLEGGTLKDSTGNDAILSCPIISGQTIKANKEGTVTNNTENQDKNIDEKPSETNTEKATETDIEKANDIDNGQTTNIAPTAKLDDKTTANITLPYTGKTTIVFITLATVCVIGVYAFKKNYDFKGI